jgi:hypothetical protein
LKGISETLKGETLIKPSAQINATLRFYITQMRQFYFSSINRSGSRERNHESHKIPERSRFDCEKAGYWGIIAKSLPKTA